MRESLLPILFLNLRSISFAAGKGSALVIDIGHDIASVTPVVDGFVLRKGKPIFCDIHTTDTITL